MKKIYCRQCLKITGYLEIGSKLAKGTEFICIYCIEENNKPKNSTENIFDDFFKKYTK